MQNIHESIHLSNVRLQMKYRKTRHMNVPEECMWDYKELQNHLSYDTIIIIFYYTVYEI